MKVSHHIVRPMLIIALWVSYVRARPVHYKNAYETGLAQILNSGAEGGLEEPSTEHVRKKSFQGLTWDDCRRDKDCLSPRTCRKVLKSGDSKPCTTESDCVCDTTHMEMCLSDTECHRGEYCLIPFEGSVGLCLSKAASSGKRTRPQGDVPAAEATAPAVLEQVPPPEMEEYGTEIKSESQAAPEQTNPQEGGAFCIGIDALADLSRGDLVFERDEEALVLCDAFGSCATAGHVVVVNGSAMMMSSYCKGRECGERIMLVNSPRYRRDVRIRSRTPGVFFTGYSARYGTQVEEIVFRVLTRLGF